MGAFPSAAAQIKPPEDPLNQYSKLIGIQHLSGELQVQQAQLQEANQHLQQTQAMNDAFKNSLSVDAATGKPSFDRDKVLNSVSAANQGSLVPQLVEKFNQIDKSAAELRDAQDKHATAQQDYFGNLASEIKQSNYSPAVAGIALAHAAANGYAPQTVQIQQQIAQNPDALKQWVDQAIAGSPKQRELAASEMQAQARMKSAGKQPEGEQPLQNVDQMNQALTARYQVLNPGKPLPPPFTLAPTATQKDYDRIDKILNATEQATGAKAQQDTSNALRQQTASAAQSAREDREAQQGLTPVIGTDPNTGKPVLVPISDAKAMGLTGSMKAGEAEVSKAQAARHWIQLADTKGDPAQPETMGILPLIDKLDKEGKLGVLASRYNDFMAGKVGSTDADVQALRTKMGLSTTLLMNAHVGNRGGAYMLEHFQDLANAGKMDASTLRTGVKSELDYIKDRAMLPATSGASKAQPPPTSGSTGKAVSLAAAKKLQINKGKSDDEIRKDIESHGHTVTD